MLLITLLILSLAVSLYDLRTGKVPNWVTLPLLCVGILAHFPGSLNVWLFSLVLYTAWHSQWMSAGDAKLWMALVWALPAGGPATNPLVFFATFFVTGLLQVLARKFKRQPLTGIRSPGAWRTIPFILWSLYVH
jgi:Flp pilus assembly protein protease CpaA